MITAVALPFLTMVDRENPRAETKRTSTIRWRIIFRTGKADQGIVGQSGKGEKQQKYQEQDHEVANQPDLVAVIGDAKNNLQGPLIGIALDSEYRGKKDQQDGREGQQAINIFHVHITAVQCHNGSKYQEENKGCQDEIDKLSLRR